MFQYVFGSARNFILISAIFMLAARDVAIRASAVAKCMSNFVCRRVQEYKRKRYKWEKNDFPLKTKIIIIITSNKRTQIFARDYVLQKFEFIVQNVCKSHAHDKFQQHTIFDADAHEQCLKRCRMKRINWFDSIGRISFL